MENGMGVEKMKRFVLGMGCLAGLVLAPSIASAALQLDIGPKHGATPSMATSDSPGLPGRQALDLIFTETDPVEANEGLFAYDLLITVPSAARDLVALNGLDATSPGFVLGADPTKYTFTIAESDANHILANIASTNDLFPINTGQTAGRVFYTLTPAGLVATATNPQALLALDPGSTVFGSGDPNRTEVEILVDKSDMGVVGVVPEPTSLSLLGLAGLLALRRRRTA